MGGNLLVLNYVAEVGACDVVGERYVVHLKNRPFAPQIALIRVFGAKLAILCSYRANSPNVCWPRP